MTLRTKTRVLSARAVSLILGTLVGFAFAVGAVLIGRGCDERERERGRTECREQGGRFTELHGRQEGWSCTFPEGGRP